MAHENANFPSILNTITAIIWDEFLFIFNVIIDCLWWCLCHQHTQPVSRSLSSPVITDAVSTSTGAVITVSFWRLFTLFRFCVRCIFSTDFPHLSLLIISCVFCVTSCPLLLTICPSPLCHMGCVLQKRIVGTALMSSIVRTRPVSA